MTDLRIIMPLQAANDKPFVSILITAYNRKDYVVDAIRSALNQTISRDNYEILLVHNIDDVALENFCENNGIVVIKMPDDTIGSYMLKGLETSHGDIICFLDDDDLFLPNKLETLRNIFSAYPDLMYFKNEIMLMDSGIPEQFIKRQSAKELPNYGVNFLNIMHSSRCRLGHIFSLVKNGIALNLSSIAVRRKVTVQLSGPPI